MKRSESFQAQSSEMLLKDFQGRILARAHGNYTKSYESYKRIANTEKYFTEALRAGGSLAVLDVGCGDGYHLFLFDTIAGAREKARFCGMDLSPWHVAFASRVCRELAFPNADFLVGSAESLPFPDGHFDVVLCSDVVEHLPCPERCFSEMARTLKPGGTAIVTTPNATSRLQWLIGLIGRRRIAADGADEGDHISLKGLRDWIGIAREAGFIPSGVRRGALIFGGPRYNRHPLLFALVLAVDRLLDLIPFTANWGEAVTLRLSKPRKV